MPSLRPDFFHAIVTVTDEDDDGRDPLDHYTLAELDWEAAERAWEAHQEHQLWADQTER